MREARPRPEGGEGGKTLTRAEEVAWTLDHLDDLESDFSAIHGIGDMYALPGPRFFTWAPRLAAYRGVMRARLEAEQVAEQGQGERPPGAGADVKEVPSTGAALAFQFGDLMDVTRVSGEEVS